MHYGSFGENNHRLVTLGLEHSNQFNFSFTPQALWRLRILKSCYISRVVQVDLVDMMCRLTAMHSAPVPLTHKVILP